MSSSSVAGFRWFDMAERTNAVIINHARMVFDNEHSPVLPPRLLPAGPLGHGDRSHLSGSRVGEPTIER